MPDDYIDKLKRQINDTHTLALAIFHDMENTIRAAYTDRNQETAIPRINIAESEVLNTLRNNPNYDDQDGKTIWPKVKGYLAEGYFQHRAAHLPSREFRITWDTNRTWQRRSKFWQYFEYAFHDSGHTDYVHDKCITREEWDMHYDPNSPKFIFGQDPNQQRNPTVKFYIHPSDTDNPPQHMLNQANFVHATGHKILLDSQRNKEQQNLFSPNNMNIIHAG